jgi:hypothetical protein
MKKLGKLKKEYEYVNGIMDVSCLSTDILKITYKKDDKLFTGFFNFGQVKEIEVEAGYDVLMKKEFVGGKVKIGEPLVLIIHIKVNK